MIKWLILAVFIGGCATVQPPPKPLQANSTGSAVKCTTVANHSGEITSSVITCK